jgi:hydroxyethylthiazole kinase-like uncharacterized protein yjeF
MNQESLKALTLEETLKLLPNRAPDTHKGQLGHVLIIGGDYGMGGAVRLAGEAALRSGAGRVSVATRKEHAFSIIGACSELMCHGIEEATQLTPLLERATVIVLGPGLGQTAWSESLFEHSLKSSLPMVVDADALNLLAKKKMKRDNWILTPHPGEASRLLNNSVKDIQQDRVQSIQTLQKQFGGVIVLKGANSLVLGTQTKPEVCHLGNPGMATAGMGDVLSGILGALIGQGLSLEQAAKLGVCVHATAGDKVALYAGQRGMKASDLFSMIQICLNPID